MTDRLVSIDVLRGFAALAVTLFHAALFVPFILAPNFAGRSLAFLLNLGFAGVYLFFVISGFCIHLRWVADKVAGRDTRVVFVTFWKRRFRRLYPGYLAALAGYTLLSLYLGNARLNRHLALDVGLHAVMLHNLLPATTYSISGLFWTLAVEEQLYLAYFLLLALRRRFGWSTILLFTLSLRGCWFVLGFAIHRTTGASITVTEAAAATWFCWVLGALAVEAAFGLTRLPKIFSNPWAGAAVLAATAALHTADQRHGGQGALHYLAWLLTQPMWSFGFFFIVNALVAKEQRAALGRWARAAAFVGVFSYSLYLTHDMVFRFAVPPIAARLGWSPVAATTWKLLIVSPICLIFAWIFYRFLEKPFLNRPAP